MRSPVVINVNRHIVAKNRKPGACPLPPIRVSRGRHGKPVYTTLYEGTGKVRVIYNPDKPLPCGATVWIEVEETAA
jgi:hypothetical protein